MKLLIENWRKFLKEQKIQEATEEEIENLKQLLEMPAGALPFNDFLQKKQSKRSIWWAEFCFRQIEKKPTEDWSTIKFSIRPRRRSNDYQQRQSRPKNS